MKNAILVTLVFLCFKTVAQERIPAIPARVPVYMSMAGTLNEDQMAKLKAVSCPLSRGGQTMDDRIVNSIDNPECNRKLWTILRSFLETNYRERFSAFKERILVGNQLFDELIAQNFDVRTQVEDGIETVRFEAKSTQLNSVAFYGRR